MSLHLKGANSLGIWFDNQNGYTEQLNMTDVGISNSMPRCGLRAVGELESELRLRNLRQRVPAGREAQNALKDRRRIDTYFAHSVIYCINWIFEDLRDEPGQQNTFILHMADNSALLDNDYSIFLRRLQRWTLAENGK